MRYATGKALFYLKKMLGRHNALDKILGYALLEDIGLTDKMIVTSGRISSEMALKVVKSRIPVLVFKVRSYRYSRGNGQKVQPDTDRLRKRQENEQILGVAVSRIRIYKYSST
ncbi:MAG: hypothetical protein FIA99_18660 [Ruminiclostridium sp.]|nr:hypothetical protein [Ruminiclostridium sp.]